MTKAGAGFVQPIAIPFDIVSTVTPWLQSTEFNFGDRLPILGRRFWESEDAQLSAFTRKLEKSWCRPRRSEAHAVTLWTVTRPERRAAYGYMKLTWLAGSVHGSPVDAALSISALHVALILHKKLDWLRGQPRQTATQARRLLREYERTDVAERCKFSGSRIRKAREIVQIAKYVRTVIADLHVAAGGALDADLLQLIRERYFLFANDSYVESSICRLIDGAEGDLAGEIKEMNRLGGMRWRNAISPPTIFRKK